MRCVTNAESLLIGGELVPSTSGAWDISINPADEEPIGRTPAGTTEDVGLAADAAERAWPDWAARTATERGAILNGFADAIAKRAEEILNVEVTDTGNTIRSMRAVDMPTTIASLRYFAGLAADLRGDTIPATRENLHLTVHEPYGVVARIAPFNHPAMFAVARTAAALAVGNAVIVKPPESAPLSAMIIAEIARDSLPAGVFNIVTGEGKTVGDAIARHPRIKRIAFIGSPQTGRAIQRAAAEVTVKHISLELGGKNPLIAFPDCNPETVANAAIQGMNFSWQGQSCGSLSRLLLHKDIYARTLELIVERVADLKMGDPRNESTDIGPVNSRAHMESILAHCANAEVDGLRRMLGGSKPAGAKFARGFWVEPTVYADVGPKTRLWQQEVFGPVLAVTSWETADEAIAMANSTEYGLTAAIWTNDLRAALKAARNVRAGHIWINGTSQHFPGVPFGGMRTSGVGREEGRDEMHSFSEMKSINIML